MSSTWTRPTPPAPTLRARLPQLPLIGDPAPEFEAESTSGTIRFPEDYKGKWVILFSHPGDFTPVCTSEFIAFGAQAKEFERLGAALIGLSTDSLDHHQRWKAAIREQITFQGISGLEIPFPIIADEDQEIAWRYDMLVPKPAPGSPAESKAACQTDYFCTRRLPLAELGVF